MGGHICCSRTRYAHGWSHLLQQNKEHAFICMYAIEILPITPGVELMSRKATALHAKALGSTI